VKDAKRNSAGSVYPFSKTNQTDCIKFNHAHHPAWIAVIDSFVFWGPTPISEDAYSKDFLFHKHHASSIEGRYWIDQFNLLWNNHSHSLDEEKQYNELMKRF
jgi:hypothetical protein